jgi:DNA-binding transcriptional regulator PaaX
MLKFLKEKSIPYEILMYLKDLGSDFAYFTIIHPPRSMRDGLYHMDRRMNDRTKTQGISKLKRQGLLKEYIKDGERYFKLTQKGKIEIMRYKLKQKTVEMWDGKWRVIIFDIAEATRKDRDFLRNQLKWLGFLELQKSVWVFPYDIKNDLQEFVKLCRIEFMGDIRFLTVEHINEDSDLRQHFGLK